MRTGILDIRKTPQALGGMAPLRAEEGIELEGSVNQNISGRKVTVLKGASLQGDVWAGSMVIYGEVHGKIRASSIRIMATARVDGELMYETLSVDPGAIIEARCTPIYHKVDRSRSVRLI